MSPRRTINGDSERAYRVVRVGGGPYDSYYGPYSTLGAAKGMKTRMERYSNYKFFIEQTPEGWERVE